MTVEMVRWELDDIEGCSQQEWIAGLAGHSPLHRGQWLSRPDSVAFPGQG